ncbi:hypothetical protein GCM10010201_21840 [Pilimelia columellifera subsp. columellifera]|uniref:Uncharacterized protein n=1 Tax=Pilimelia columellifera subsp. columellifera TaxID=706583 RepID=A0ABP6ATQ9_9ACTN
MTKPGRTVTLVNTVDWSPARRALPLPARGAAPRSCAVNMRGFPAGFKVNGIGDGSGRATPSDGTASRGSGRCSGAAVGEGPNNGGGAAA